jgi:hypothetical protein
VDVNAVPQCLSIDLNSRSAPQLLRLEIRECKGSFPEVFEGILSLPNVRHLTIDYSVLVYGVIGLGVVSVRSDTATDLLSERDVFGPAAGSFRPAAST